MKTEAQASLVVTLLNEECHIEALLQSVVDQEVTPAEVILVDGGSTDGSLDRIEAFAEAHPEITVRLHRIPGTIGKCRNFGVSQAAHEHILSTDAGCRLAPDFVKVATDRLRDNDIVVGRYVPEPRGLFERSFCALTEPESRSRTGSIFSNRSLAYRRQACAEVGGFREDLLRSEDTELSVAWKKLPLRLCFEDRLVVHYIADSSLPTQCRLAFRDVLCDHRIGVAHELPYYWKVYVGSSLVILSLLALTCVPMASAAIWLLLVLGLVCRGARVLCATGSPVVAGCAIIVDGCIHISRFLGLCAFLLRPARPQHPRVPAVDIPTLEPDGARPQVSIVIPNWNGRELLHACLSSIAEHTRYLNHEVIVVDNGSIDGSVEMAREHGDSIRLIDLPENLGFPAACNIGVKESTGDYVMLLNNDTEVSSGWLDRLVAVALSQPDAGVIGCRIAYPEGLAQESGMRLTPWAIGEVGALCRERGRVVTEVDYVSGSAVLIKRAVLDTVGMLDEAFSPGMYEETDLCARAKRAGFRVVQACTPTILHARSQSWNRQEPGQRFYIYARNRLRFKLLNFPVAWLAISMTLELLMFLPALLRNRASLLLKAWYGNLVRLPEILALRRVRARGSARDSIPFGSAGEASWRRRLLLTIVSALCLLAVFFGADRILDGWRAYREYAPQVRGTHAAGVVALVDKIHDERRAELIILGHSRFEGERVSVELPEEHADSLRRYRACLVQVSDAEGKPSAQILGPLMPRRVSARARVSRITPDRTVVLEVLGKSHFAGEQVTAKLPDRYPGELRPGQLCLASLSREEGRVTAEILGPLRERVLLGLFLLFALIVVLTMGAKGVRTVLALGAAAFLMVYVFLPLVVSGRDPLWLGVAISVLVCGIGIFLIGGPNRKSCHALIGAIGAVLLAGWIPWLLCRELHFTGLEVEFGPRFHLDVPLWYSAFLGKVNFANLLVAGMLISGLGAVMDVAMTVSTSIAELRQTAPHLRAGQLRRAGTAVGKDILGMMAITLLFVYAGTNLEMLLLSRVGYESAAQWGRLLSSEGIGSEVIRLAGCGLGLVFTIPLTALAASLLGGRKADA